MLAPPEKKHCQEKPLIPPSGHLTQDFLQGRIGIHRLDLVVEKELVVKLKTVDELHKKHYAQVRSYLKATSKPVGLLVNFSEYKLDPRRVEPNP